MPVRSTVALTVAALALLLVHDAARATERTDEILGETRVYVTRYEDMLPRLAQEYDVGFVAPMAANPGVDPWLPGAGREIILPTAHILPYPPRRGIVINLTEFRLYHFWRDGSVETDPVGIGREY